MVRIVWELQGIFAISGNLHFCGKDCQGFGSRSVLTPEAPSEIHRFGSEAAVSRSWENFPILHSDLHDFSLHTGIVAGFCGGGATGQPKYVTKNTAN